MFRVMIFFVALFVSGCTITQTVNSVTDQQLTLICVEKNDLVHMEGFLPAIMSKMDAKGLNSKLYSGARPEGCSHTMSYSANWRWDMAMYLYYAEIRVFDGNGIVGSAVYDARMGGANMDKFGSTESKIGPLIDQLFSQTL